MNCKKKILNIVMSDEINDVDLAVNDILSQLKQNSIIKKEETKIVPVENKEIVVSENNCIEKDTEEDLDYQKELEKFVYTSAKRLIDNSMESVEYISTIIQSAPTPDDVSAYASAVNSTNAAIGSLLTLLNNNKKTKNQMKIKKMDIESKKQITDIKVNAAITMTREEALSRLIGDAKTINTNFQILTS